MKNNRRNFQRGSRKRPQDAGERSRFRDTWILAAWIAGLCLVGGLAWALTQPLRSSLIIHTVNRTLERNGENRRLDAQISPWLKSGAAFQLGNWYTVKEGNERAVIFSIMNDGILAPYAAFLLADGTAEPFIPLSAHAGRLLGRLPEGILQTYVRRVEAAEQMLREEEKAQP